MAEYNGTIDLISGIRPKNNGSFPLVDAKDVQTDDNGKRLNEVITEFEEALLEVSQNAKAIPEFNLTEMGLPALSLNTSVTASGDMTELIGALKSGAVKLICKVAMSADEEPTESTLLVNNTLVNGENTIVTSVIVISATKMTFTLVVLEGLIIAFLNAIHDLPAHTASDSGKILSVNAEGNSEWVETPSAEAPSAETPVFDLASLGLPNIPYGDMSGVELQTDTTEIMAALAKGEVTFKINASLGEIVVPFTVTVNPIFANGGYTCGICQPIMSDLDMLMFQILDEGIAAVAAPIQLGSAAEVATSIDLSMLDSSGQIVETYADGSTKTTQLEFDESGNPIKITDGDGNVTEITW